MRIDLVGTPGEEFVGGKCYMTENGAFDEYEYAAMIHLYNRDSTYFEILASMIDTLRFMEKQRMHLRSRKRGLML